MFPDPLSIPIILPGFARCGEVIPVVEAKA
jgi:hypothetical protein